MDTTRDMSGIIADIVAGRWVHPRTGQPLRVGTRAVAIAPSLEGREARLVDALDLGSNLAVVSGPSTYEALGRRVERALRGRRAIQSIVLPSSTSHEPNLALLTQHARHADALVGVGGGAISDLVKLVAFRTGRRFCLFPTSAAMNGYTTASAALTLSSGLKSRVATHVPEGLFIDLGVLAEAPRRLLAAGFGNNLARFSAQVDWWVSHRLLGTPYLDTPYLLQAADEAAMLDKAALLATGDIEAIACLVRVAILSGFGMAFAKAADPGSMSEHAISDYLDMVARPHPRSLHGEQVGLASVQMTRLQARIFLAPAPPRLSATCIDEEGMIARYGAEIAGRRVTEYRMKTLDAKGAKRLNLRLASIWPTLRQEVAAMLAPGPKLAETLVAAGGHDNAEAYGIPQAQWREAILHARELDNRFTILDIADDSGQLASFADGV